MKFLLSLLAILNVFSLCAYDISQPKYLDPNYRYEENRYCTLMTILLPEPNANSVVMILDTYTQKYNAYVTNYVFNMESILWCLGPIDITLARQFFRNYYVLEEDKYGF